MNTIELQNSIIKKILDVKDAQLLKYLQSILDSDTNENIYQLSEEESLFLKESMADYENGHYVSNDDVVSKIEKWLDK